MTVNERQTTNSRYLFLIVSLLLFFAFSVENDSAREKTSLKLGVRNAHAMAYDSQRGRAVLFGGADAAKVCGDTWQWDGTSWTQVSFTGPAPRTFPAMTYDSHRKRIVMFGGNRVLFGSDENKDTFLNDTWEWDGQRWLEIKVAGPSPRAEAAIAFDGKRRQVMLFGGYDRTEHEMNRLGDTWEWDGTKWVQLKVIGPSPRNSAAQAYDAVAGKIVLFGGRAYEGVSGETWAWDGKQWLENRLALNQPRFNSVLAFDEAKHVLIRFGGFLRGQRFGDTWAFNGKEWKGLPISGPSPRNHTAMVYDSKRERIILFGGHDGEKVFGDTWEWDGSRWLQREGTAAQKRVENDH